MEGRISATGLKSVEIDELTTNQIIINNEGLQYYHNYNILLPTVTEGYYNLQEELDNIMISNTTQDLELIQLEARMGSAEGSITTLGAGLVTVGGTATAAFNLANQKSWILFFQKPLRSDISSNVYLDFDTNYFSVDSSNNLTLNNLWKKDISNNLYFTSGKVGIGLTNPGANYSLDVLNNINCAEIYRNGTPISSTLSLFLPLTGGTLTGTLTGTNMTASLFSGSGASLTNINASNVSSGTLSITRGGIGTTTLSSNQILIGNGTTSILQSPNLIWDNVNSRLGIGVTNPSYKLDVSGNINCFEIYRNGVTISSTLSLFLPLTGGTLTGTLTGTTISATNMTASLFTGSGASLTNINASNVSSGTLSITRGGIGTTTLSSNQLLIGNGTTSILQSPNLIWDNSNNMLGVGKTPAVTLDVSGNINALGGTIAGKILINGTVVNDYSLQIKNNNYTCPVLCIDSGLSANAGYPNTNARAIGMPLLGIGGNSFNGVGDYYAIGLGYCSLPTRKYCCEIGCTITNTAAGEYGDLLFSLRNTTVNTDIATERMRITSNGNVGIGTTSIISGIKLDCRGTIYAHGLMIGDINTITANSNNVQTPGNYQLNINPPTATSGASIQTIKQGTGSNQDLILQGSGGRVCIANNGPYNSYGILDVGGDNNTTYYSFFNKLRIAGNDPNTIWQTSVTQPHICLTTSNASSFIYHSIGNGTIKTTTGSGGFGINTGYGNNPRCHLEVNGYACIHNGSAVAAVSNYMQSGSLTIGGTNANYGGNFYTGAAWTGNNTAGLLLECKDNTEIVVHDSATRLASLMYYEGGSNQITIGRNMGWSAISSLILNGRIGVQNTAPLSMLHLGNCTVANSAPVLVFGKNNGAGGYRNAFMGYTDSFFFVIGDYGNTNSTNTLTSQLAILYSAPQSALVITATGYVQMAYGSGTSSSDERIKTNIRTIENALDKTLLLRGVNYYDFRIEPDRLKIGLIAQEVEYIIPEVVHTDPETTMKSIEYGPIVALLIEAVKEQQKQINELKNILIKNNLY